MPRFSLLQKTLWLAALLASGLMLAQTLRNPAPVSAAFRPGFALADGSGRMRTEAEFAGKYLLVFFGFTNCPDVCPTTLSEVAQVMDELGRDSAKVQPIFISIDPERDRRLGLDAYTQAFHPAILGLAGDEAATKAAADSFKVYFKRETDTAAPDGYSMAHSPALYLVGPNGDWLRQFAYGTAAPEILNDLKSRF